MLPKYNYDKLVASEIKSTLVGFYNDDELVKAKDTLLSAVSRAPRELDRATEVPRLPKRTGDNHNKQNAEDLLKLFTLIDEQNLSGSLPVFTAVDLSRIPFLNPDCEFNVRATDIAMYLREHGFSYIMLKDIANWRQKIQAADGSKMKCR